MQRIHDVCPGVSTFNSHDSTVLALRDRRKGEPSESGHNAGLAISTGAAWLLRPKTNANWIDETSASLIHGEGSRYSRRNPIGEIQC
jgi:hypothetical protein